MSDLLRKNQAEYEQKLTTLDENIAALQAQRAQLVEAIAILKKNVPAAPAPPSDGDKTPKKSKS